MKETKPNGKLLRCCEFFKSGKDVLGTRQSETDGNTLGIVGLATSRSMRCVAMEEFIQYIERSRAYSWRDRRCALRMRLREDWVSLEPLPSLDALGVSMNLGFMSSIQWFMMLKTRKDLLCAIGYHPQTPW